DVREPVEYHTERIPGALLYPLSTFDATQLPKDESRQVVFHCASGGRSLKAASLRQATGQPGAHMAGGIAQWKASGLPVIRIDPRTGRPVFPARLPEGGGPSPRPPISRSTFISRRALHRFSLRSCFLVHDRTHPFYPIVRHAQRPHHRGTT